MFRDDVLNALKQKQKTQKLDAQLTKAIEKMQKRKKLSTSELLKVYDALWKEGPRVKSNNCDAWINHSQ